MSSLFEEDLFLKLAMNMERQNTICSQSIFLNNFWPQQLIETDWQNILFSHQLYPVAICSMKSTLYFVFCR